MKTLSNTNVSEAKENTPDLKVHGNGDLWQCICKVSSASEGWMKSTKVMEIAGVGCLVQVTTQLEDQRLQSANCGRQVAVEALTFVPDVQIALCGTKLVASNPYVR